MGIYELSLATVVCINIILAVGLNTISGFCGQISLGHAAFYGIGAYTAALLARAGVSLPLCLLAGFGLTGLFGVIIGLASLRVKEDFLAITTMGVAFLFVGVVSQQDFLGGEMGISNIPSSGLGKTGFLILALCLALLAAGWNWFIKRSWMGFAFDAVADDEDTAKTLAINVGGYKLAAFAIGTALAGLAGGLYVYFARFISPGSFGFLPSIGVLSMVVIGGIGSVTGVVLATVLLTLLPEMFRFVSDYKLLIYGLLLFGVMRFAPEGLAGFGRSLCAVLKKKGAG